MKNHESALLITNGLLYRIYIKPKPGILTRTIYIRYSQQVGIKVTREMLTSYVSIKHLQKQKEKKKGKGKSSES